MRSLTAVAAIVATMILGASAASPAAAAEVRSKAGARASVSARYAASFQALINDLEAHGAVIRFMGGIRPGSCGQASKHPCGMALDVCQLSRGVVDRRCRLPGRTEMNAVARRHGLFSGGEWCSSDHGHVEAGGSTACGHRWTSYGGKHERDFAGNRRRGGDVVHAGVGF